MSKKKGFRTALATILVVLVIFAALTFAAIKYFLPMYQVSQSEVYSWAVKIYPLLIGITLIVIASMLGKDSNEDEGEEEDKLPPNSYDAQLFEEPKDDPATKQKKNAPTGAPVVPKVEEPETISDEAYAELISIFSTDEQEPEDEIKPFVAPEAEQLPEVKEEPVVEPLEEVEVKPEVEEPEEETEPEADSEPEAEATEEAVEEAQPETEPEEVEEEQPEAETEVEEEAEPVEEPAEVPAVTAEAPAPVEDPNKALVSAINALVEKMDDFTTAMIYGSEEDEDEEDEEEEYDEYEPEEEEPEETEEAVEEVEEEAPENDYEDHLSRIEQQISSLSDIVAKLADTLKNLPTPVVAPAESEPEPVATPEPEVEAEVEPEPAPEEEVTPEPEPKPEEPESVEEEEPEAEPVDTTGSQIYKEYEGSPAKQTAMAEFDSAKDFGYDLTIAKVSAEQSAVALQLDDVQCIANGNNTLVIIPFADNAEAKEVLDKLGVPYEVKTMEAGSDMSFEDFAKDWIN